MKKIFAYCLLMALIICSCRVGEINDSVLETEPEVITETKVFSAIIEDNASGETKSSLDGNGNVLWKMGDRVSIFVASTVNEQYQVSDASDGKTAASLNKVGGSGFVAGTEIDNNVAFYPYASTASIARSGSSYIISDVELPATQSYAPGSFGNGAFPMAAVTSSAEDLNLKFKNILGGVKLQLKGTATIAAISITGNDGEILYGPAQVTASNGNTPSVSLTDASAKTVTLNCGAGVTLDAETATPFIIALPPITMTRGFTVLVTDTEDKQMIISTTKSQTITRSQLLKMPAVDYVGVETRVDLGLSVKWASWNLGATSPEEYGNYYALDQIDNNNIVLDPEDDVAHVNLGGNWRMPTDAEWTELRDNCTWTWTTQNGVYGRLVTSNINGNSIFLPAAGGRRDSNLYNAGAEGYYWSSSLNTDNQLHAWLVILNSGNVNRLSDDRRYEFSARPVLSPAIESVSINKTSLSLIVGETQKLTATVLPSEAAGLLVSWVSSNPSVATVTADGVVSAVSAGTATIFASAGSNQTTCTVTVTAPPIWAIAGEFNGWNAVSGVIPLQLEGDAYSVHSVSLGGQFKFVKNGSWTMNLGTADSSTPITPLNQDIPLVLGIDNNLSLPAGIYTIYLNNADSSSPYALIIED